MARENTRAAMMAGAMLLSVASVSAGPITPPPGPVSSTPGPEPRIAVNATNTPGDADSVFRISAPGSYYLTGNVVGVAGKHGIEIDSSGVTLDLNGFDVVGVSGMGAFDGIRSGAANLSAILVKNGSVRGWGDDGIEFAVSSQRGIEIENVRAIANAGDGFVIAFYGTVRNCEAIQNGSRGISTTNGCIVESCRASENAADGIEAGVGSIVVRCASYDNGGLGIELTGAGGSAIDCVAYSNGSSGIMVFTGCTVSGCTARLNTANGILATSQCVIRGNTTSGNGVGGNGAGILVTGSDNRIEGNNCIGGQRGIEAQASGNLIVRNSCSGNTTSWVIAANNIVGPILDRRAPASAAINGFSATSTLGSTDANANFSY